MTLEYSPLPKNKKPRIFHPHIKQIEITIRKNGVIRIELIPKHLLNKK